MTIGSSQNSNDTLSDNMAEYLHISHTPSLIFIYKSVNNGSPNGSLLASTHLYNSVYKQVMNNKYRTTTKCSAKFKIVMTTSTSSMTSS